VITVVYGESHILRKEKKKKRKEKKIIEVFSKRTKRWRRGSTFAKTSPLGEMTGTPARDIPVGFSEILPASFFSETSVETMT